MSCRHDKAQELSGGNQQKIAIGRLLHHDADVFLLDDPTRGIDVMCRGVLSGVRPVREWTEEEIIASATGTK